MSSIPTFCAIVLINVSLSPVNNIGVIPNVFHSFITIFEFDFNSSCNATKPTNLLSIPTNIVVAPFSRYLLSLSIVFLLNLILLFSNRFRFSILYRTYSFFTKKRPRFVITTI